jgi:hypothetical protein
MKIEIHENENLIDLSNVSVTDYKAEIDKKREQLHDIVVDFSVIKILKGDKNIIDLSFQDSKNELLN